MPNLTHEEVDVLEQYLRDSERDLEHAGQILCSVSGDVGPQLWHKINQLISGVQGVIHQAYLLRPLD